MIIKNDLDKRTLLLKLNVIPSLLIRSQDRKHDSHDEMPRKVF